MCPSQTKPLSSLTLAFTWYENWKNAFCWGRWLVVSRPWEKENYAMPISTDVLLLDVSYRCIYIFSFGPFKSLCTPLELECRCKCLWVTVPAPPNLPVCKLPTVNFIIALYEATCFVFRSQSSFSVQREVFSISAFQQTLECTGRAGVADVLVHKAYWPCRQKVEVETQGSGRLSRKRQAECCCWP